MHVACMSAVAPENVPFLIPTISPELKCTEPLETNVTVAESEAGSVAVIASTSTAPPESISATPLIPLYNLRVNEVFWLF